MPDFITKSLYRLKKNFGQKASIQWRNTNALNLETGKKTVTFDGITINRAIVLPNKMHRDFQYDLAFIGENKNFTYGAYYNTSERNVIVDTKDLPADFIITLEHWFVINDRRWDVKSAEEFEHKKAWFLNLKEVQGSEPNRLLAPLSQNDCIISDEVSYVVE
jgi:hypothetical protein